jgi:hypothetical protein
MLENSSVGVQLEVSEERFIIRDIIKIVPTEIKWLLELIGRSKS